MRFNPQETTGSRVRLRYSVDLHYELSGAVRVPAQRPRGADAAPDGGRGVVRDRAVPACHGRHRPGHRQPDRRVQRRVEPASTCTTRRWWRSRIGSSIRAMSWRKVRPSLPVDAMRFLYPSRYCQADLVQQRAWDLFGHLPRGYAQVRRRARLGARQHHVQGRHVALRHHRRRHAARRRRRVPRFRAHDDLVLPRAQLSRRAS